MDEVVVVVSGGEPPDEHARSAVPSGAPVVAADRGLEHALSLGLEVTVAVGDFDSASPEAVDVAVRSGTRVERHPREKDASDLELALDAAFAMGPARILVVAGEGGRLDHLLSTLLLLGSERYAGVRVDARVGSAWVHVIRGSRALPGALGELVSLLALHGPAVGVTTEGLAYPLRGETLGAGSSRGVSNVFAEETARIAVEDGTLLAIRPGESKGQHAPRGRRPRPAIELAKQQTVTRRFCSRSQSPSSWASPPGGARAATTLPARSCSSRTTRSRSRTP